MKFRYSKENLTGKEAALQRIFEILPGAASWSILIFLTGLSILQPLTAMLTIIALDLYWLFRLLYMTFFLIVSFLRLEVESTVDWLRLIHKADLMPEPPPDRNSSPPRGIRSRLAEFIHQRELRALRNSNRPPPRSGEIYHLVIIPVAKESVHIIEPGLISLKDQTFPARQLIVVLAVESWAPPEIQTGLRELQQRYRDLFLDMMVVIHPAGRSGEAKVKGANVTWAARKAADYFRKRRVCFDNITVSCFDADTIANPDYFACLTYYFMVSPNRLRASFQPIPVYHNNIWNVPGFARVMETGSSFFQLIESTDPEHLVTFSSHSMSFAALVAVDYWPIDMISDDSAIFWKSFIHYHGAFSVVPMYTTVSMDITVADSLWQTMRSIYKQKRRWAWGAENFPIVMRAFLQTGTISRFNKIRYGFKLLEGHVSWATWGFILTILSWLPTFFAQKQFTGSVVYYNAPYISGIIFNLASVSLLTSIILSVLLLPKTRLRYPFVQKTLFAAQWLFMPVFFVFLSALPALDAQTRMLLGKRLKFWVALKRRT